MVRVIVHRGAARFLKRLPADARRRIKKRLGQLRAESTAAHGVQPMVGQWKGYYRIRVGGFRVIFWLDEEKGTLYVDHIGPRGDVYK